MEPIVTPAADGVFHVEGAGTNWQILVEDSHVTLIDAAWPKDYDLVARSLEKVRRKPADVEVILLTHAHRDHLGTIADRREIDLSVPALEFVEQQVESLLAGHCPCAPGFSRGHPSCRG